MNPAIVNMMPRMITAGLDRIAQSQSVCPPGGFAFTIQLDRDCQRPQEAGIHHPALQAGLTPFQLIDPNVTYNYPKDEALAYLRSQLMYPVFVMHGSGLHLTTVPFDDEAGGIRGAYIYSVIFDSSDWERDEAEYNILKNTAIKGDSGWYVSSTYELSESNTSPVEIPFKAICLAAEAVQVGFESLNEDIDAMTAAGVC